MPFGAVLKELQRSTKGSPSINGSVTPSPASDHHHQASTSRSEALRSAASAGDFDRVKELCKKSVAIDADGEGRTALHYASLNGHLQIVKEIISMGAKVNVKDAVSDGLSAAGSPHVRHLSLSRVLVPCPHPLSCCPDSES